MIVAAFLMCDGRESSPDRRAKMREGTITFHLVSTATTKKRETEKKEKIQKNGGGGGGETPSSLVARAVSLIYDIIAGTLCLCFPEEYLSQ